MNKSLADRIGKTSRTRPVVDIPTIAVATHVMQKRKVFDDSAIGPGPACKLQSIASDSCPMRCTMQTLPFKEKCLPQCGDQFWRNATRSFFAWQYVGLLRLHVASVTIDQPLAKKKPSWLNGRQPLSELRCGVGAAGRRVSRTPRIIDRLQRKWHGLAPAAQLRNSQCLQGG